MTFETVWKGFGQWGKAKVQSICWGRTLCAGETIRRCQRQAEGRSQRHQTSNRFKQCVDPSPCKNLDRCRTGTWKHGLFADQCSYPLREASWSDSNFTLWPFCGGWCCILTILLSGHLIPRDRLWSRGNSNGLGVRINFTTLVVIGPRRSDGFLILVHFFFVC